MKRLNVLTWYLPAATVLAAFAGCDQVPESWSAPDPPLGLMRPSGAVEDPRNVARSLLGRELFFDRRLSKDSSLSCASCHVPTYAFAEPRAVSHGLGRDARRRNTPTLLNASLQHSLGWDGSADNLKEQLLGVFAVDGDMGMDVGEVLAVVRGDPRYRSSFRRVFGREPDVDGLFTALTAFQQSLLIADSPFDRYFFQSDSTALTPAQLRGYALFQSTGCAGCHTPVRPDRDGLGAAMFTDSRFHNLGVGYEAGRMSDVGRFAIAQQPHAWGAFRTPSLRNVELTAPYMHDGSLATLTDVLRFYVEGGKPNPHLDPAIVPLSLSEREQQDIVAFLHALTSRGLRDSDSVLKTWIKFDRAP